MTEAVLEQVESATLLFATDAPRPLRPIALGEGRAGRSAANRRLGPGAEPTTRSTTCSPRSAALGRDPTDVELMMFAQANSEHCRHKIFNAEFVIDGVRARAHRCLR